MKPSDEAIKSLLQQVADAVATVLRFDVTVTDDHLCRIAGTGAYAALVGEPVPRSSSFAEVLRICAKAAHAPD